MNKPHPQEYYPGYQKYIDRVEEEDLEKLLLVNTREVIDFFNAVHFNKHHYRYQPNKWTVKDILMHLIDTERGFSYRAIVCVRRDDQTPLYVMDENFYASNVDVTNRSMESMLEEFLAVRKSFALIFKNATDDDLTFLGSGIRHKLSARALGYIAIGHTRHHMTVIRERYLN